jgi:hypothetical protein
VTDLAELIVKDNACVTVGGIDPMPCGITGSDERHERFTWNVADPFR